MNYSEIVEYIESVPRFAGPPSIEHTKEILTMLGNPDQEMKIIHVAGTNGKGSVCSYIESMLREDGCRTGLFTSPHLVKMNERFRIENEPVDDEIFSLAFERVKAAWEIFEDPHPTYFEILFLMSMVIFSETGVEVAIMETGLGGRMDATNAVHTAEACIITSISRDHCAVLGNDIKDIAAEKAGIMKPGVPCFYIDTNKEVSEVMKKHAGEVGCPAYPVSPEYGSEIIKIASKGQYQKENSALAYYAMQHMPELSIPEETMLKGLAKAYWPGRMEEAGPDIYLDGAHNEDGVRAFAESAAKIAGGHDAVLLFSAVSDKEYKKMAALITRVLKPVCVVTAEVSTERAVPCAELAGAFIEAGCANVKYADNVKDAFETALGEKKDAVLFCVGSLYLI